MSYNSDSNAPPSSSGTTTAPTTPEPETPKSPPNDPPSSSSSATTSSGCECECPMGDDGGGDNVFNPASDSHGNKKRVLLYAAADRAHSRDNLGAQGLDISAQGRLGPLGADPEQPPTPGVYLIDAGEGDGRAVTLATVYLVDADQLTIGQFAVFHAPLDARFDLAIHGLQADAEDAGCLPPGQAAGAGCQERRQRGDRALANAPGNVLHNDALVGELDPACGAVEKGDARPEGRETPAALGQRVIARARLPTRRPPGRHRGMRFIVDLDGGIGVDAGEADVAIDEARGPLNPVQSSLSVQLDGCLPWMSFGNRLETRVEEQRLAVLWSFALLVSTPLTQAHRNPGREGYAKVQPECRSSGALRYRIPPAPGEHRSRMSPQYMPRSDKRIQHMAECGQSSRASGLSLPPPKILPNEFCHRALNINLVNSATSRVKPETTKTMQLVNRHTILGFLRVLTILYSAVGVTASAAPSLTITNAGFHTFPLLDDAGNAYPSLYQWAPTGTTSPVVVVATNKLTAQLRFSVVNATTNSTAYIIGIATGLVFTNNLIPIDAGTTSLATIAETSTKLPYKVDYKDPLTVSWFYGIGGGSTNFAGTTSIPTYITLANPLDGSILFRTLVHNACATTGATSPQQAVNNTWSRFGSKSAKTWNNTSLYYYKTNIVFSDYCNDVDCLLSTGTGTCVAWANFFAKTLAVNGISSEYATISCKQTGDAAFMVRSWSTNNPGTVPGPLYKWRIVYHNAAASMVPNYNSFNYGDLTSTSDSILGQGPAGNPNAPAEKVFVNHYLVKYPTGASSFVYYDPAYGEVYTNTTKAGAEADFDARTIFAYGNALTTTNGSLWKQQNFRLNSTTNEISFDQ